MSFPFPTGHGEVMRPGPGDMVHSETYSSASDLVTVTTEQMQLRTLGFGIGEVSWSSVRMTSDDWICVTHRQRNTSSRCNGQHEKKQLQATVIDPFGNQIRSLQLDGLTSAQVSPLKDMIALSTTDKIFTMCLKTNQIVCWNRFPCDVEYWTWVGKNAIGIVGRDRMYNWLTESDSLSFVVNRSPRLRNTQITNYQVDSTHCWHVVQALKSDSDGSICGVVQVFSAAHNHSTVLEAEATSITAYKFAANSYTSQVLVVVNKTAAKSAKISVVELGPQHPDRNLLVNRCESFHWQNPDDIATNIVCSPDSSLIYVLSKKGILFVFGLETCCPYILNERVCCDIVFVSVLDKRTTGVLAVARNGQILSVVAHVNQSLATVSRPVDFPDQVTRL